MPPPFSPLSGLLFFLVIEPIQPLQLGDNFPPAAAGKPLPFQGFQLRQQFLSLLLPLALAFLPPLFLLAELLDFLLLLSGLFDFLFVLLFYRLWVAAVGDEFDVFSERLDRDRKSVV